MGCGFAGWIFARRFHNVTSGRRMKNLLYYFVWRLRVLRNRRRHKDIVADEFRGVLKPEAAASYMLRRDRYVWDNAGGANSGLRCPDLFDYNAHVPYAVVAARRKERAADLV